MGPTETEDSARRLRVLVVDDDPLSLDSLDDLLRAHFDVVASASPAEALSLAAQAAGAGRPFDVVCSDFRMQEMDGGELLLRIARLPDSPACILITGYVDVLSGEHGRADHVLGVVVKPFDSAHLVSLIGRLGRITRTNRSVKELTERIAAR